MLCYGVCMELSCVHSGGIVHALGELHDFVFGDRLHYVFPLISVASGPTRGYPTFWFFVNIDIFLKLFAILLISKEPVVYVTG